MSTKAKPSKPQSRSSVNLMTLRFDKDSSDDEGLGRAR